MKRLFLLFWLVPGLLKAQNSTVFQSWNELGLAYKIDKKQSIGFDFTSRIDVSGLQTFFPQISYKYKVNKYLRPSLDYRLIGSKDGYGNYSMQHRLNVNLQFAHEVKRLQLGFRVRYQISAQRSMSDLGSEFGNAFRFKPTLAYNLNNSFLSPNAGIEFFANPMDGQTGYHLSRIRWNIGVSMDLKAAGELELAYLYDQRIYNPGALNRAILNLGYNYTIASKDKKGKKAPRNGRFL
ncbi:MAG: DUF2490 domain-containing protein [Flavobacteriales bacterium]